jgi:hypothetical protein
MQPSPYDRTVRWLRPRLRRHPVASLALLLSCAWIVLNVYETTKHWRGQTAGFGWFQAVAETVSLSSVGVVALAALVWLIDRATADHR